MLNWMDSFRALLATREDGKFSCSLQTLPKSSFPPEGVLIRVAYSSLNYKDGLAVLGKPGVIRKWPMIPGIDLCGVVAESAVPGFHEDLEVIVTGCGLSETVWGGYSEYARVDVDSLVPLPRGLTLERAMAIGTAGFTAMQSVIALERHGLKPSVIFG